jgi:hypothetical protein
MSTTKNGVAPRLKRGNEGDFAKGEISKTLLSNWCRILEILWDVHSVITKVRSRDEKGRGNTQLEMELKTRKRQGRKYDQGK